MPNGDKTETYWDGSVQHLHLDAAWELDDTRCLRCGEGFGLRTPGGALRWPYCCVGCMEGGHHGNRCTRSLSQASWRIPYTSGAAQDAESLLVELMDLRTSGHLGQASSLAPAFSWRCQDQDSTWLSTVHHVPNALKWWWVDTSSAMKNNVSG